MNASKELEAELSGASPSVREYTKALQAENARLVRQVAKLEAKLTTANSMIESVRAGKTPNPLHSMTTEELEKIAKGED